VVILGLFVAVETVLLRLVTFEFVVELVKVIEEPEAAALAQPAEVPDVKVPPAASLRVLAVLTAAAVVLTAIL
jgi:hypothetical protein